MVKFGTPKQMIRLSLQNTLRREIMKEHPRWRRKRVMKEFNKLWKIIVDRGGV